MTESRPDDQLAPFRLVESFDVPELLGAQWWLEETQLQLARRAPTEDVSRRTALATIAVLGGAAALGAIAFLARNHRRNRTVEVLRASQSYQQDQSWDVGATDVPLQWMAATTDDVAGVPFATTVLGTLANDLRPTTALQPHYVPTLFAAVATRSRLQREMKPICTAEMKRLHSIGTSVAALFAGADKPRNVAIVADLPGRESLAFAAGAREEFAPVCVFDNWPHPRGVVPAHLTLGAAVYYRPQLAGRTGDDRRPLFVLDRDRLAEYHNENDRFDNRYLARLPDAAAMKKLGIARVLYVVPQDGGTELDDLNAVFAAWQQAGIEVRMLGVDAFTPADASPSPTAPLAGIRTNHYLGSPLGHAWFWAHYPWWPGAAAPATPPPRRPVGADFAPTARASLFRGMNRGIGYTTTTVPGSSGSGSGWGRSTGTSFFG